MAKKKKRLNIGSKGPADFYRKVRNNKTAGFRVGVVRQAEFDGEMRKRRSKRRNK